MSLAGEPQRLPAMQVRAAKRKAINLLQETAKRSRIEIPEDDNEFTGSMDHDFEDDQHDEESQEEEDFDDNSELSDDDDRSSRHESPTTPFSPASPAPKPTRKLPRKAPGRKGDCDLKTIKCDFEGCTKTFNRNAKLEDHIRSHNNDRAFKCGYEGCDKAYFRMRALKEHLQYFHNPKRPYKCEKSGCEKSFSKLPRLRKHQETHEGHTRFMCTGYLPCEEHFRKRNTLSRHIRTAHLGLLPYPCTHVDLITGIQCEEEFEISSSLRRHEVRAHGPLRFWCDECSSEMNNDGAPRQIGFSTQKELSKHLSKEHTRCMFCDIKCSSQRYLEKHIETMHSQASSNWTAPPVAERKKFTCTYKDCNKSFTKNNNLTAHVRTIHEKVRFRCSPNAPHVPYKDPEVVLWSGSNSCGREFFTKQNLEDHIRTQHLELPSFVNTNRAKSQAPSKKRTRTSRFACVTEPPNVPYKDPEVACWNGAEACDLDFTTKQDLENHIRTIHLKLSPLIKSKSAKPTGPREERLRNQPQAIDVLTGAAFSHDENRNLPCLVKDCPWLFVRQYDLGQHLRIKHGLSPNGRPLKNLTGFEDEYDLEDGMLQGEKFQFWVGAGERIGGGDNDEEWARENMEMRSLIDPELLNM